MGVFSIFDVFSKVVSSSNSPKKLDARPSKGFTRFLKNCDKASKRSAAALKRETRKFGGNPLPWEPGGSEFFSKLPD